MRLFWVTLVFGCGEGSGGDGHGPTDGGTPDAGDEDSGTDDPRPHSLWHQTVAGIEGGSVYALDVDGENNTYAGGSYVGPTTLAGSDVEPLSDFDGFLVRLDPDGNLERTIRFPGGNVLALDVDDAGAVVVAGYFSGEIDLGSGPVPTAGWMDGFVATFLPDGSPGWAITFGGTGGEQATSVRWREGGGVAIGGYFSDTVQLGADSLTSRGGDDGLVALLDDTGAFEHVTQIGGSSADAVWGVAAAGGAVFATGTVQTDADLGDGPTTGGDFADAYVASFDETLAHRWSFRIAGDDGDRGSAVATSSDGSKVAIAATADRVDLGDGARSGARVLVWDSEGTYLGGGATGSDGGSPYAVAPAAAGWLFGGAGGGQDQLLVATWDGADTPRWIYGGGLENRTIAFAVAERPDGVIVVGGVFSETAVLDDLTLESLGANDGLVLAIGVD